jgi:PAS domain S-box-containing protein
MASDSGDRDLGKQEQPAHRTESLGNIFRAAPAGIGMVRQRVITQANDRLAEMTGYRPDELINQSALILYPDQEEFERVGRVKYGQISQKGSGTIETRWMRKDGRIIDVLLSSTPLDHQELSQGVIFTALDITERKQAEEAIAIQKYHLALLHDITLGLLNRRDPDELLQKLITSAAELAGAEDGFVYLLDAPTGDLVVRAVCGPYARELSGFRLKPGEGLAGKVQQTGKTILVDDYRHWEGRVPDALLDALGAVIIIPIKRRRQFMGAIGLGHFQSDEQFGPLEQEALERLADLAALGLDNARLYDALQTELADKQATEKVLRKYEQMVESSTDYMALIDRHYVCQEINSAFHKVLGRTRTEIVGRSAAEIFGRPFFAEHHKPRVDRCLRGEEIQSKDWYNTPALGRRYIETYYYPCREDEGRVSGVLIVGRDLTHLKELEDKLLQSQKLEAIGTLAGGVAHDFNNLLMGIQGRASLMSSEIEARHPIREHIEAIETYVRNAADLTRQLLGFAQGGKYEIRPTDLNELVKNHNRMFSRTRKELRVQGSYARDLYTVEVDRGQISQVLLNIYLNAWQAMPGGGSIFVATANVVLEADDRNATDLKPGHYVQITVTDTGVGMDEEVRQRVFEPFFTTRPMGRGTGLGLASAYGIVKNHGGAINLTSEKGRGTAFTIYLPASSRPAEPEVRRIGKIRPGTGIVLLVDDEQLIIEVGTAMLAKLGYDVLTAVDGEGAIALYRREREHIAVVILDMVMPGMSGGETFDRLKAIDPDVKVLLSSGYSLDGQARDIIERGCVGFIQKPFSLIRLSEMLQSAARA